MHRKSVPREISAPRASTTPQLVTGLKPRAPQKIDTQLQENIGNEPKVNSFRKRLYGQPQIEQQFTSSNAKVNVSPLEPRRVPIRKNRQLQNTIQSDDVKFKVSPIVEETVITLRKSIWCNTSMGNMNMIKEKEFIRTQGRKSSKENYQTGHFETEPGKEQHFIVTVRDGQVVKIIPYFTPSEVEDVFKETKIQHFGEVPKTIQNVINEQFFPSLVEVTSAISSLDDGTSSVAQEEKSRLEVRRDRRAAVIEPQSPTCSESGSDNSSPTRRQALCSFTDTFEDDRRFLRMLHKKF